MTSQTISRRKFLKATAATGGTAVVGSVLAACGASTPTPAAAPTAAPAAAATAAPAAAATAAPAAAAATAAPAAPAGANPLNVAAGEVDGVFFAGGFGD